MIDTAHDRWLTDGVMGRRVTAWLVDAALIVAAMLLLKVAFVAIGILTLGLGFALFGLIPVVPFLYVVGFLLSDRGVTPGQALCRIVLRRDRDLLPPEPFQAVLWTIGLAVTVLAGLVWMLAALLTVRHRTLHDIASGTIVVRAHAIAPRTGIWQVGAGSGRPFA